MDPLPPPAAPSPVPAPPTQPRRTERRLRAQLDPDERMIAWTRGWLSRDGRLHPLLAARTLDFAVLTDRRLCFFATGFFTRLPRRRVYSARLDRLQVTSTGTRRGQRLRLASLEHRALRLELRGSERDLAFALALVARTKAAAGP